MAYCGDTPDPMAGNSVYAGCIFRKDWYNASKISGQSIHAVRIRHDGPYKAHIAKVTTDEDDTDLSPHALRFKDQAFAKMLTTRLKALIAKDYRISERYFAACCDVHQSTIQRISAGYCQGRPPLRSRIISMLERLEAGELIETKPHHLTEEQSKWVDGLKKTMRDSRVKLYELAVASGVTRNVVYNITQKKCPPKPTLRKSIDAALMKITEKQGIAA